MSQPSAGKHRLSLKLKNSQQNKYKKLFLCQLFYCTVMRTVENSKIEKFIFQKRLKVFKKIQRFQGDLSYLLYFEKLAEKFHQINVHC